MDIPPGYVEAGGIWPPHEIANLPYGAPVLTHMYSDERTGTFRANPALRRRLIVMFTVAISGDYPQNSR
jgi:hypothetical protein